MLPWGGDGHMRPLLWGGADWVQNWSSREGGRGQAGLWKPGWGSGASAESQGALGAGEVVLGKTALGPCRGGKEEVNSEPMVARVEAGLHEVLWENGVWALGPGQWEPCLFFCLKKIFFLKNWSTVAVQYYISSRCTTEWLTICKGYAAFIIFIKYWL